ncbi:MAG: hypothetical protein JW727_00805 [Candidatus Aenigmarchaeota archaeon]|nr:hypothetical protein [Candidatus Aenigmarchaeota archaeon]
MRDKLQYRTDRFNADTLFRDNKPRRSAQPGAPDSSHPVGTALVTTTLLLGTAAAAEDISPDTLKDLSKAVKYLQMGADLTPGVDAKSIVEERYLALANGSFGGIKGGYGAKNARANALEQLENSQKKGPLTRALSLLGCGALAQDYSCPGFDGSEYAHYTIPINSSSTYQPLIYDPFKNESIFRTDLSNDTIRLVFPSTPEHMSNTTMPVTDYYFQDPSTGNQITAYQTYTLNFVDSLSANLDVVLNHTNLRLNKTKEVPIGTDGTGSMTYYDATLYDPFNPDCACEVPVSYNFPGRSSARNNTTMEDLLACVRKDGLLDVRKLSSTFGNFSTKPGEIESLMRGPYSLELTVVYNSGGERTYGPIFKDIPAMHVPWNLVGAKVPQNPNQIYLLLYRKPFEGLAIEAFNSELSRVEEIPKYA